MTKHAEAQCQAVDVITEAKGMQQVSRWWSAAVLYACLRLSSSAWLAGKPKVHEWRHRTSRLQFHAETANESL